MKWESSPRQFCNYSSGRKYLQTATSHIPVSCFWHFLCKTKCSGPTVSPGMYETCSCQPTYIHWWAAWSFSNPNANAMVTTGWSALQIWRFLYCPDNWEKNLRRMSLKLQNQHINHPKRVYWPHVEKACKGNLHTWFCTVLFGHKLDQVEFLYSVPGSFSMKIWVALQTE
jgi:hypothetical protein